MKEINSSNSKLFGIGRSTALLRPLDLTDEADGMVLLHINLHCKFTSKILMKCKIMDGCTAALMHAY